jgi:hypothetical protein
MDLNILCDEIRRHLTGTETDDEIRRVVEAAGLPPMVAEQAVKLLITAGGNPERPLLANAVQVAVPGGSRIVALADSIRPLLSGDESATQIEGLLQAAGVAPELIGATTEQLLAQRTVAVPAGAPDAPPRVPDASPPPSTPDTTTTPPPLHVVAEPPSIAQPPAPQAAATAPPAFAGRQLFETEPQESETQPPRLLVHWGAAPEIGHVVRPRFLIAASSAYAQPRVHVQIDPALDHAPEQLPDTARHEGDGLWGFHVPFALTTNHLDCRPGQYLVDVAVTFPTPRATGLPRCFRTIIRLSIRKSDGEPTLEISGDGQSVVNLNGQDLRRFGRVILKGDDTGIINIQSGLETDATPAQEVTHEYSLQVDTERERLMPRVREDARRSRTDALTLVCPDGRRILLLARRYLQLGRNRENDIVTRFLPRTESNDEHSRRLSRTHASLSLTERGLLISDKSTTGIAVAGDPVTDSTLVDPCNVDESFELELGISLDVERPFLLEVRLFGRHTQPPNVRLLDGWELLMADALGEPVPRQWQTAVAAGIDSLRLRRRDSLRDTEEYVALLRQAWIGSSTTSHAICLPGSTPGTHGRILHAAESFWLEGFGMEISVDGTPVAPGALVPLSEGMTFSVGETTLSVEASGQSDL